MASLLALWDTIKKDNRGKHYHNQGKKMLFVLSVEEILGKEILVLILQKN